MAGRIVRKDSLAILSLAKIMSGRVGVPNVPLTPKFHQLFLIHVPMLYSNGKSSLTQNFPLDAFTDLM